MQRKILPFAIALFVVGVFASGSVGAADPQLTIYRSDSDMLFNTGSQPIADGHAIVHEQRTLQLTGGRQTLIVDGLPTMIDAEAVTVDLGKTGRVLARRVMSAGDGGMLAAQRGGHVQVFGPADQLLADGTLLALDGTNLGIRDNDGRVSYLHEYSRIAFPAGAGQPGSTLQLVIDGNRGIAPAMLTYPTSGLGWRAAYAASLQDGDSCRLSLDALASIANRSGRDYPDAALKLIAGAPNFARQGGGPTPMMMKAMPAATPSPGEIPQQSSLGDYRSYRIGTALDLPDGSVTQVPLYASQDLACARRWLFENGSTWVPPKPNLAAGGSQSNAGQVQSQLTFRADENLPSGTLRVLVDDRDGRTELLGESRIADTPKGKNVDVMLGSAFDLAATRERTAFNVDRTARTMSESYRISLANSGESARTVTVREHPDRWRVWKLESSSVKPAQQTPDMLEFRILVPAAGTAVLDYALRYSWQAGDEPNGNVSG